MCKGIVDLPAESGALQRSAAPSTRFQRVNRAGRMLMVLVVAGSSAFSAQDSALVRLRHRPDSLAREWRQAGAIPDRVERLGRESD